MSANAASTSVPPASAPLNAETQAPEPDAPATLDVKRDIAALPLAAVLKDIQTKYGKSYQQIFSEIVKLGFGPGKISMEEYLELGLFDDVAIGGADKRAFIGYSVSNKVWSTANYRHDWHGFFDEKLAVTSLLGAYGYPVIPTRAIFSTERSYPSFTTLKDADELRTYLIDPANYPMFGKPTDSFQSLGSISLDGVNLETGKLKTVSGGLLSIDDVVRDICENYAAGYMFQPRIEPHKRVREICGNRLATVRVVTILTDNGPKVFRALWKVPAGNNAADNFWRPGNLLAQLNPIDGKILRVQSGTGLNARDYSAHPDSGAQMVGTHVPHWAAVIDLALEAAKVLKETRLLGWDIAPTDDGAIIVEPNYTPDLHLLQIADRRGIMDDVMTAFLGECVSARDARRARNKSALRAHTKASRQRVLGSVLND